MVMIFETVYMFSEDKMLKVEYMSKLNLKRTNSFEKKDIESTVINLSEFQKIRNYLRQLIMIVKP